MASRAPGGASGPAGRASVEQQRVRIRHTLFTALALSGLAYCVVAVFLPAPQVVIPVVVAGVVVTFGLRKLAARGRVELAVILLLLALALMMVAAVAFDGNIGASPMYLPVLVATAGASLYPRQVVWAVLGAVVVLLAMRLVGSPEQLPTSANYMLTYALVVTVLVGVVAWVSARSVSQALASSQEAQQRAESLAAELEGRVAERTRALELALHRQEELSAELSELSFRDPLTGLHNRRHLDDELEQMFAFARRSGNVLSVAVIDLDDFKSVNDRFTHVVGDDVLRFAADVLVAGTRTSDVLVRMGGEEFALLMPATTAADAYRVCERMRSQLESHDWTTLMPHLRVTASFGVAASTDHATAAALIRAADERLIHAKRAGKNRVEVGSDVA